MGRIMLPGEVDPDPENDKELHVRHRQSFTSYAFLTFHVCPSMTAAG